MCFFLFFLFFCVCVYVCFSLFFVVWTFFFYGFCFNVQGGPSIYGLIDELNQHWKHRGVEFSLQQTNLGEDGQPVKPLDRNQGYLTVPIPPSTTAPTTTTLPSESITRLTLVISFLGSKQEEEFSEQESEDLSTSAFLDQIPSSPIDPPTFLRTEFFQ